MRAKLLKCAAGAVMMVAIAATARAGEPAVEHWSVDIQTEGSASFHDAGDWNWDEAHPTYHIRLVDHDAPESAGQGYDEVEMAIREGRPQTYRDVMKRDYVSMRRPVERRFDPFGLMTALFGQIIEEQQATVEFGTSYIVLPKALAGGTVQLMIAANHADLTNMVRDEDGVEHPELVTDTVLQTLSIQPGDRVELSGSAGRKLVVELRLQEIAAAN